MYLLILKLALIAYVYSVVLTDQGMILNRYFLFLEKNLPEWLFFPIVGCFKCVAGQFGLWGYLIYYFRDYNTLDHLVVITGVIFLSVIINKLYIWLES